MAAAPAKTTTPARSATAAASDLDEQQLKSIEELTRRLTSGDFGLNDSDDDDADDDEDDATFQSNLMAEFRNMLHIDAKAGEVPKSRLKELYLELLTKGGDVLQDKAVADAFLARLVPAELAALLDLMAKNHDDILRFFDGDAQVLEAIRNAPGVPASAFLGGKAKEGEWDFDDLDDDDENTNDAEFVAAKRAAAAPAVRKALEAFEANLTFYAQHPDDLLKLSHSLPTTKDSTDFLDILFTEYTPEKMQQRINADQQKGAAAPAASERDVNPELVAFVFKEVLSKFAIYKRSPAKFDGLVSRMNEQEKEAFEALVKAFWDVQIQDLKL